jgi:hypothetical protein
MQRQSLQPLPARHDHLGARQAVLRRLARDRDRRGAECVP